MKALYQSTLANSPQAPIEGWPRGRTWALLSLEGGWAVRRLICGGDQPGGLSSPLSPLPGLSLGFPEALP